MVCATFSQIERLTFVYFIEFSRYAVLMIPAKDTQATYGHMSRDAKGTES